tara:strand:- start:2451 stop:2666 length:216 start_codon:yes stop_codon:yes gene_type:complete
MKTLTTPIAIIISGIVIAISIVVSTIIYEDANKYTFVPHANSIIALSKDGDWYYLDDAIWKKSPSIANQLP